jgi:hypothetical protein
MNGNLNKCLKYYNKLKVTPQNSHKVKIYKDKLNYYLTGGTLEDLIIQIKNFSLTGQITYKSFGLTFKTKEFTDIKEQIKTLSKSDKEYIKEKITDKIKKLEEDNTNIEKIYDIYRDLASSEKEIQNAFNDSWRNISDKLNNYIIIIDRFYTKIIELDNFNFDIIFKDFQNTISSRMFLKIHYDTIRKHNEEMQKNENIKYFNKGDENYNLSLKIFRDMTDELVLINTELNTIHTQKTLIKKQILIYTKILELI